ncbi:hypothetical protein Javan425_0008 [Streptococcus phage Javan425]|uniref:Phage protein n=1 Tax=Streptococcus porcinus str. Jelinkova 176 TaxID=873448 RepID=A0ABN0CTT4_STRPO|nr:DUF1366 domain-containing protein [Streptococcus porcinus]EGJ26631.1 hypothetical protein STRPO_0298 [Streptococcus porcinus str. Jelinkova 176]QBX18398.1 hypothetical protein Javan423_0052 [Streptococcus phage Javan423]QBX18413.1 hypothetical protein Javan425_0008 [Streptococcus phage Javan425]SQG44010.1 Protein of uncharacterised function (DUF1366) [Streptococcus porcinus]
MFKVITKFPKELEDKSITGVTSIIEVDLPHVKGSLTFDLPPDFDNKTFAETLEKCEQIFYDEKYKDKAQTEKMTELSAKTSTGTQSLIELINILYKKGTLNDEDFMVLS